MFNEVKVDIVDVTPSSYKKTLNVIEKLEDIGRARVRIEKPLRVVIYKEAQALNNKYPTLPAVSIATARINGEHWVVLSEEVANLDSQVFFGIFTHELGHMLLREKGCPSHLDEGFFGFLDDEFFKEKFYILSRACNQSITELYRMLRGLGLRSNQRRKIMSLLGKRFSESLRGLIPDIYSDWNLIDNFLGTNLIDYYVQATSQNLKILERIIKAEDLKAQTEDWIEYTTVSRLIRVMGIAIAETLFQRLKSISFDNKKVVNIESKIRSVLKGDKIIKKSYHKMVEFALSLKKNPSKNYLEERFSYFADKVIFPAINGRR
ncbi:MAG: hypothetical protein Q6362_010525 [Candidatus Wukongarchaeota archaeon]|nr:hypothetical protein [Candidatus Wukongarchaeota archaeon]